VDFTTRLVTLASPGVALSGVLDALEAAVRSTENCATAVGRADRMLKFPGQPDGGCTVFEFTTDPSAAGEHYRFIDAARQALIDHRIPYAWCSGDTSWQSWTDGRISWRRGPDFAGKKL
jgi:hypothetical protein